MLDFWKAVLGMVLFSFGILLVIINIKNQKKEGKDKFGNNIEILTGAIIFIIIGIFLFIKELMKL